MNLWLLACLATAFVGACIPVHAQGVAEDCCLAYHPHVALQVLLRARHLRRQEVSGSCNLPVVIFYLPQRGRLVCGNPRDPTVRKAEKLLHARNKAWQRRSGKSLEGSQTKEKKVHSGPPRPLPALWKHHHLGGHKQNASRTYPGAVGAARGIHQ